MRGGSQFCFLAILSTVLCYVWYADGILTIGPEKSSLYIYLVPPFGILSGWLILDEKLGWSLLWSFLLICSGVALAQSDKNHHEQHPSQVNMSIENVAVIGAGTMGAGIAQVCAQTGWNTTLYDAYPESLERGMQRISAFWDKGILKEKNISRAKAHLE